MIFGWSCWGGNAAKQDQGRLEKVIKKAGGVVRRRQESFNSAYHRLDEWQTDWPLFWPTWRIHWDQNLTADGLTEVEVSGFHVLWWHATKTCISTAIQTHNCSYRKKDPPLCPPPPPPLPAPLCRDCNFHEGLIKLYCMGLKKIILHCITGIVPYCRWIINIKRQNLRIKEKFPRINVQKVFNLC